MTDAPLRSGRVESPKTPLLIKSGNRAKSAGDSLHQRVWSSRSVAKRSYVTRSRVEAIRSQLNKKQLSVISDVDRLGIVSGRQLQELHYGPSAAGGRLARMHLGQLVGWRVLDRLGRSVGGARAGSSGYVYSLGPAGQRLVDPNRARYAPRWTPRMSYLRHALAVSDLYVGLRLSEGEGRIELERYDTEPRCWRRYFGPGGSPSVLKPDAFAVVGSGDLEYRYFLEVDCGTEHRPQIIAKAKTYIRYFQSGREQAETAIFPFVLWTTPDEKRSEQLVGALASLAPEHWHLFLVATAGQAVERIASGTFEQMSNRKEVT